MAGEKTEKATPKRRKDERKKGNVLQSKDIVSAISIIAMFYGLKIWSPYIYIYAQRLIGKYVAEMGTTTTLIGHNMTPYFIDGLLFFGIMAMPLLLLASAVTIIGTGIQTKFMFSGELLKPKFSRLDPIKGFAKLFSIRSIVELFKSLLKISAIAYVIYDTFVNKIAELPKLLNMEILPAIIFICLSIFDMIITVAMLFIVISVLDYGYQWWDFEKNIKMSKQDVKEEYKQMEGDPQVKGKQKERQREAAAKRMMQAVPTADVVIRNPTHFAIAIAYDTKNDRAPKVVAKGQDRIALKIIEIAEENNVVITENKPLARALYANVDIGTEIPPEFYQPVAEVLAFVYSLNKKELN